ncbi:1104_t:CDS:2, partial [Acaulospora colombiana]
IDYSDKMIFKSKLPDIEIPPVGVYQFITSNPNNISDDKVIFIDGITDKRITFGEFKSETRKFAAGLHDKVGFRPGDVLSIVSPNQFDYPIVLFGAIAAGGIVSPVNPTYNVAEVSFQLSNSGASVVVSHPLALPAVVKAATEAGIPHSKIFVFGDKEIDGLQPYRSSGTTGKSKGVETTHTNMVANASQMISFEKNLNKNDVFVVQDYKISYANLVPPIVLLLAKKPIVKEYDLSSLRTIVSGAAPLSKSLMDDLYNIHKISIKEGYELGYNERGELCVRGPNIMKGYLNNKAATDAAIDKDGFFHTGDVAIMDEQGNLYIVDRVKELIKYKGFQVPPAELEEILISHQAVLDAAVIGVYCEADATEYALAYVVPQTGYERSQESIHEIKEYVSNRVAPHKRLKDLLFIDQIPKSASGKILRRILKEKALE